MVHHAIHCGLHVRLLIHDQGATKTRQLAGRGVRLGHNRSGQYGKRHQRKTVQGMLTHGDKLVDECVQTMVSVLKSDEFKSLIDNERQGLENNYRAYLNAASLNGITPSTDLDRLYIENRLRVEMAEQTRRRCITMLQSFGRAHSALVKEMQNRRTYSEFMDELFELNRQITAYSSGPQ